MLFKYNNNVVNLFFFTAIIHYIQNDTKILKSMGEIITFTLIKKYRLHGFFFFIYLFYYVSDRMKNGQRNNLTFPHSFSSENIIIMLI